MREAFEKEDELMLGLLYKDMILKKRLLILLAVGLVIFSAFAGGIAFISRNSPDEDNDYAVRTIAMLYLVFIYAADAIESSLFGIDETRGWMSFITSSAMGARGQIKAKYLGTLLLSSFVAHWCYFTDIFALVISDKVGGMLSMTVITMFFVQLTFKAVEIPFVVYFGEKNGNNVKVGILLILIFAVGIYFLFGDLSLFGSMDDFMKWLTELITGEGGSEAMLKISAVVPYISIALYYFSYRISCRLYTRGAVNYVR